MESMDYLCRRVKDVENEDPGSAFGPVRGLVDIPLMALENAVKPLVGIVPEVEKFAEMSVQFARWVNSVPHGCGRDGIAAINLLTREWEDHHQSLYNQLNQRLRDPNRENLKPFLPVLKLLLNGLCHLPTFEGVLWRGVDYDISAKYPKGKVFPWWGVGSCIGDKETEEGPIILGKTGERTFFCIQTTKGHSVGEYAEYLSEAEVMIAPGRYFKVADVIEAGEGLTIIELTDAPPPAETMDYPL